MPFETPQISSCIQQLPASRRRSWTTVTTSPTHARSIYPVRRGHEQSSRSRGFWTTTPADLGWCATIHLGRRDSFGTPGVGRPGICICLDTTPVCTSASILAAARLPPAAPSTRVDGRGRLGQRRPGKNRGSRFPAPELVERARRGTWPSWPPNAISQTSQAI